MTIKTSDIAAGLTAASVKDAGGSEQEQLQRAQLAASLVERAEKDELEHRAQAKQPESLRHKPTHPPGPGMLNRIVRWLNLK